MKFSCFWIIFFVLASICYAVNFEKATINDELLEFLAKAEGNRIQEFTISSVIQEYMDAGCSTEVLHLLDLLDDTYNALKHALQSDTPKNEAYLEKINSFIPAIRDNYHRNFLKLNLGVAYSKIGKVSKARQIFTEIYKDIQSEQDLYEKTMRLVEPDGLCSYLIEAGFLKKAQTALQEGEENADRLTDKNQYSNMINFIVYSYKKIGDRKKIKENIGKMNEANLKNTPIGSQIIRNLFELGETLIENEEFDDAKALFAKVFKYSTMIKNRETLSSLYANEFLNPGRNLLTIQFLGNIEAVSNILKQSISYETNNKFEPSSAEEQINKSIISFFVFTSRFEEAKAIAQTLDKRLEKSDYADYYYLCLGKKFLESFSSRDEGLRLARRIKNSSLKLQLMLKAAETYDKLGKRKKFKMIMTNAHELLSRKKNDSGVIKQAPGIARIFIDAGFPEKVQDVLTFVEDEGERSLILYDAVQTYVDNCRSQAALEVLKTIDKKFEGLIISKVAARMMCDGKKNESIFMFKKAIKILLDNDAEYFVNIVFRDYLYALRQKRIVKVDLLAE